MIAAKVVVRAQVGNAFSSGHQNAPSCSSFDSLRKMIPHLILLLGAASFSLQTITFDVLVVAPRTSTTDDDATQLRDGAAALRQSWLESQEILEGAQLGLMSLNQRCFPFRLSLTTVQTDCSSAHGSLVQVIRELTSPDKVTVAVLGIFCKQLLRQLPGITQQERLGVVTVALNPSLPEMTAREHYYQAFPSAAAYAETLAQFMKHVQWTRIAVVTQITDRDSFHLEMLEQVAATLTPRGLTVVKIKRTGIESILQTIREIHDSGLIAIYVLLSPVETAMLICGAYEYGLRWPDYGWVVPDTSLENAGFALTRDCGPQVAEGIVSFQTTKAPAESVSVVIVQNKTCHNHKESDEAVNGNIYARAMYDSVHTIDFALNDAYPEILQYYSQYSGTHTHHSKLDSQRKVSELLRRALDNSSSENTFFDRPGTVVAVYQIIAGSHLQLAVYYPQKTALVFANFSNVSLPSERLERVYRILPAHIDAILSTSLVCCVLFIFVNMCLYIYYRRAPEMKASGVGISMMIYVSCYVMCIGSGIDLKTSTYIVKHSAACTGVLWAIHPWGDIILATLLVQVGRIYHIFSHFGRIKKFATDRNLLAVIFLIVFGKTLILSLWTALDEYRIVDVEIYHSGGKPPYYEVIQQCYSDHFVVWNSITIGYSAILISFVVLVSYKTRKIHRKDFKNTKKINIFLAVVVSATAVLLPLWWVFRSVDNTVMSRIVIVSLYLLLPVSCQACLFCPKTLPPLQRSFSKAVCQRRRQSKERSRSTEKVLYLQRPDPSQLSLLLPQDSTLSYTLVLNKPTSTS